MADVSKLNVNGTSYNIKDSSARTAISASYDQETNTLNYKGDK